MVHAKAWMNFFVDLMKTGQVFKVVLKLFSTDTSNK